jgi:hypothetical protein
MVWDIAEMILKDVGVGRKNAYFAGRRGGAIILKYDLFGCSTKVMFRPISVMFRSQH